MVQLFHVGPGFPPVPWSGAQGAHMGANQSILLGHNPGSRRINPAHMAGPEEQEARAVAAVFVSSHSFPDFFKDGSTSCATWCHLTTKRMLLN